MKMKHNAQTISADALIAVALFMVAIIFFFSMSNDAKEGKDATDLKSESSKLVSSLSSAKNSSDSLLIGSKVNERKLSELSSLNYSRLKDEVGADADFCIHFEDDKGNIINISGSKTGLGNELVVVGGTACG